MEKNEEAEAMVVRCHQACSKLGRVSYTRKIEGWEEEEGMAEKIKEVKGGVDGVLPGK